ncbi:cation transporter [Aestuariispira insulae]|uniref:Mercuric ion binding protein n=1 Tax=Aestuariispira insulae TaxID=1461337 RepID=A0A3D9H372_9PROT|nr:cation transporter [Aestuariispira insulae]RED43336.1 mercuric ion binding protein [Aestuariispira insulae]
MRIQFLIGSLFSGLVVSQASFAAERETTLLVENMTCASCPYIVKQSLTREPGVVSVTVSFTEKTAHVIFDDSKTTIQTLEEATASHGFPSRQRK